MSVDLRHKHSGSDKAPAPGGGYGIVLVHTEKDVYHKGRSRFYGTTKRANT